MQNRVCVCVIGVERPPFFFKQQTLLLPYTRRHPFPKSLASVCTDGLFKSLQRLTAGRCSALLPPSTVSFKVRLPISFKSFLQSSCTFSSGIIIREEEEGDWVNNLPVSYQFSPTMAVAGCVGTEPAYFLVFKSRVSGRLCSFIFSSINCLLSSVQLLFSTFTSLLLL